MTDRDAAAGQTGGEGPATDAPAPARRRALAALGRLGWPLLCLFLLGLAAGAFHAGTRPAPSSSASAAPEAPAPALPPRPHGQPPVGLEAGVPENLDDLIRSACYERALTRCAAPGQGADGPGSGLPYRAGLCLEGLGRWDEALAAYRAAAHRAASPRLSAAARLSMARVWMRTGRPAEARVLLADLILRSGQPALRTHPLLPTARYLLALALSREVLRPERPGPFYDGPVSQLPSDWPLDTALDLLRLPEEAEPMGPEPPAALATRRVGPRAEDVLVRGSARRMPATDLLGRLAEGAGLTLEWPQDFRQRAGGRSVRVELDDVPLPDVLRALAEPLDLTWQVRGRKLLLAAAEGADTPATRARRRLEARQALGEAVLISSSHALAPAAYLELGNLEMAADHPAEAAAWYGRLTRQWPHSPLVIEAQYNLGLLRQRTGDAAAARQAFYRVVDGAPGHPLAPLAHWRLGRLYLEEGEPGQALSPLRRALATAPGTMAQSVAALAAATAHLLNGNPAAANAVLLEYRAALTRPHYRAMTAFLDSLARCRACPDRRQRQREASDLLAALLALPEDSALGPAGLVLAGEAYGELGMSDPLAKLYVRARPQLHGLLRDRLTFALGEAYHAGDRLDEAWKMFRPLAEPPGPWRGRARLRLAEIALRQDRARECVRLCRRLLADRGEADAAAVLRLMAGAYEQAGERDKAIRCLSGEVPAE